MSRFVAPQSLDFLYSNMSRLVAPHVTNRIQIILESKQRSMKSMLRRLMKSKEGCSNPRKEGFEIQAKKDFELQMIICGQP